MSFKKLYERRQQLKEYVSRKEILELVQEITDEPVRAIIRGMDTDKVRGFFLPISSRHWLTGVCGGKNLIVVARENNRCWRRLVIFKEAMHFFDTELEQTSTPADLEELINEFVAGSVTPSLMFESEGKAFWMGLSLIMREEDRIAYGKLYSDGEMSAIDIATKFRMPKQFIPHIFSQHYKRIIQELLKR